jgi:predicted flap endonuclease-1-like 5' DNA nuclease
MTTPKLPEQVVKGGVLDPEVLVRHVYAVGADSGLTSRVNYNLACWYTGKAARAHDTSKGHGHRRAIELRALRQLELAVAGGARIRTWARTDPSLDELRSSPVENTREDFWDLVGRDTDATGELGDISVVGPAWSRLLDFLKVKTRADLQKRVKSPDGRSDLAGRLDAPIGLMSDWNEALQLVDVVGTVAAANLIGQVGITTIKQLARADATDLARRLERINESPKVLLQDPEEDDVTEWIDKAKRAKPEPTSR